MSRIIADRAGKVHGQREWLNANQYFFSFVKVQKQCSLFSVLYPNNGLIFSVLSQML